MACVSRNIRRTFHVPSGVPVQRSISERDCSHPVFSVPTFLVRFPTLSCLMGSMLASCPFLRIVFLGFHFRHDLFQRFDRFRFLTLEPLKTDAFDKLRKRSFTGLLPVVVYLAELVGIQPQFAGYVKLYITRVMGTYKLCKVQVTNLNQILKYLYF